MDHNALILNDHEFNLSDFALFLSVMKNPKAYKCALSIFMEEPEIELAEVKVEQVILNKIGKRAIRLDAWAKSTDNRQFNMEMQNDTQNDDVRKRSRYYQSMLDTPILKSGKEMAKYTFTERCKEIEDLELEDGTTKIFLNMTSKNGSQELISLLQYMKDTRMDNPNIIVKDSRILELDQVVQEVKASEEWEAVKMNILEIGIENGIRQGIEQGEQKKLRELVAKKLKKGNSISDISEMLEEDEETIKRIIEELQK